MALRAVVKIKSAVRLQGVHAADCLCFSAAAGSSVTAGSSSDASSAAPASLQPSLPPYTCVQQYLLAYCCGWVSHLCLLTAAGGSAISVGWSFKEKAKLVELVTEDCVDSVRSCAK